MRPHADVKLFRLPPNLNSKSISVVKAKLDNKFVQLETKRRRTSGPTTYKSRLMLGNNNLAVSVVKEDSIFLTRVSDTYEFKPKLQEKEKTYNLPAKTAPNDASSSDDEKVTTVTMRFAATNEEDKKKARESLYSFQKEQVDKEDWCDMEFVSEESDRSTDARAALGRL